MIKIHLQIARLTMLATLATGAAVAQASEGFTDSVYSWGSWELGIEPAAGGPIVSSNRAARVNEKNMQFRPNSNNAFTNARVAGEILMGNAGNNPTLAPIPAAPAAPPGPAAPIGPGNVPNPGNPAPF